MGASKVSILSRCRSLEHPIEGYSEIKNESINNRVIEVFNKGKLSRDFTYIDDIINGVEKAILLSQKTNFKKHELYNLGNNSPVALIEMINLLESIIGRKAKKKLLPMQLGDVKQTFADIVKSKKDLKFEPKVKLKQGLFNFVNWYKEYRKL